MNTISFLAFSKKAISVGAWMYDEGTVLKEAEFCNNPCKNLDCPEPLPTVMAAVRVDVTIPGFYGPMRQEGTSVSNALITRFIAQTWNANPSLKSSDFKKYLKGRIMTFNHGIYQWKGSTIYKLEDTEKSAIPSSIRK